MGTVIVMTYRDRQPQLTKTLLSLNESKSDFRVVIVDDDSPDDVILPDVDYDVTVIKLKDKKWNNPDPAYNTGLIEAAKSNPRVIMIQNAECFHVGDVVKYAESMKEDEYLSFACFSLSKESTEKGIIPLNNLGAIRDGQDAWYNHPVYRPVAYEFCAAIAFKNMKKLNGYDERLKDGWGYGDNYLLHRIKLLGLKISIPTYPFICHQWHYNSPAGYNNKINIEKNRQLFEKLKQESNYRATHLITENL